ncbi:hypothetical protein K502DRAFT_345855 [Neoconidiobolus thromboides FSU 785]|nr:hypothetical protein K502DRAFT_345855 [Neoconidiobolus thromboides FSU 785]
MFLVIVKCEELRHQLVADGKIFDINKLEYTYEKKLNENNQLEDQLKQYLYKLEIANTQVKEVDAKVRNIKRESWVSLVPSELSAQITVPVMNDIKQSRKMIESERKERNRVKYKSFDFSMFEKSRNQSKSPSIL